MPMLIGAQPLPVGPFDAGAAAAPLQYRSAFGDYRRHDGAERADWREINRTVEEAARKTDAHAGQGAVSAPARAPAPAAAGSGGHGMHHGSNGGA
ncbi:MAG: hypothetical protein IPK29_20155 [Betaproteobacteria bacterium]|nr:hypothetical protein [Betaproteobacteria bacterium]